MRSFTKNISSAPKRSVVYNPNDIDLEYDVSYDPVPTNPFQAVAAAARNKNSHRLEEAYEYGDEYGAEYDDRDQNLSSPIVHGRVYLSILTFLVVIFLVYLSSSDKRLSYINNNNVTNDASGMSTRQKEAQMEIIPNALDNPLSYPSSTTSTLQVPKDTENNTSSTMVDTKRTATNSTDEANNKEEEEEEEEKEKKTNTTAVQDENTHVATNPIVKTKTPSILRSYDPFEEEPSWYGSIFAVPPSTYITADTDRGTPATPRNKRRNIGYLQHPNIHNGTLVFCTEGDLYVTYLSLPLLITNHTNHTSHYQHRSIKGSNNNKKKNKDKQNTFIPTSSPTIAESTSSPMPHQDNQDDPKDDEEEVIVKKKTEKVHPEKSSSFATSTTFPTYFPTSASTASPTKDTTTEQPTSYPTTSPTNRIQKDFTLDSTSVVFSAIKLTETIGNVLSPVISPLGDLVAFTATYTGSREVYILSLNPLNRGPALRVSYLETAVESIVGWTSDGSALLIICSSLEASLPDSRLYKLYIKRPSRSKQRFLSQENREEDYYYQDDDGDFSLESDTISNTNSTFDDSTVSIGQLVPIPLASVVDAAMDSDTNCIYFVKAKQSSHTMRYVGGTAENIWVWCDGYDKAINVTTSYRGSTKSPKIWNQTHLLLLSDRSTIPEEVEQPTTMNLFAMRLPFPEELYDSQFIQPQLIPLTTISCTHNGIPLSEYSVDPIRGDVVLRIGADFEIITSQEISTMLMLSMSSSLQNGDDGAGDIESKTAWVPSYISPPHPINIAVYSDFNLQQERRFVAAIPEHVTSVDVFLTPFKQIKVLLGLRGQVWVTPVLSDISPEAATSFTGGTGQSLPLRRYRVIPGSNVGGIVRVLAARYIPTGKVSNNTALILATDPLSPTAELAFYLVDCGGSTAPTFLAVDELPTPILGGHLSSGGSTRAGGLGSIYADTLQVSPCGRRAAWVDTDGRIMAITIPNISTTGAKSKKRQYQPVQVKLIKLKRMNNRRQPITGFCLLTWSPAGRYIAITHNAANQFDVISIADLGDPDNAKIILGRVVQATPDRFNSFSPVWGRSSLDFSRRDFFGADGGLKGATMLYYLSDRDVVLTDIQSPWGTRAPSPYYPNRCALYALPLQIPVNESLGTFVAGGAAELFVKDESGLSNVAEFVTPSNASNGSGAENMTSVVKNGTSTSENDFFADLEIDFGGSGETVEFDRRAYKVNGIDPANYVAVVSQLNDDPSFILVEYVGGKPVVKVFGVADFPSDRIQELQFDTKKTLESFGMSTDRNFIFVSLDGNIKIIPNTASGIESMILDVEVYKEIADTGNLALSVMPVLEYEQMYSDAWRMLRDYFYDPNLHHVDWLAVHERYKSLVDRCSKREELDDVLGLMASELSALHVFVYGGEYEDPLHGSASLREINYVSSLGAFMERNTEANGYVILSIHEGDPDFDVVGGLYSPLSERTLAISGQKGLKPGDVILGVNGESVLSVPDINYLLRGLAGRSIRLDLLRTDENTRKKQDVVIVVPISKDTAANLRYSAWEWKTRQEARRLAKKSGFSVGYMHLREMGASGMDAFTRSFFPDYNKEAFIIDVRHNRGGNIDSWLLNILQRRAWTYWESRATNITTGGEGWDEMFAFRGHLVVLIDEHTSSDGEGFARGVSELKLGKLIGKRTWGGGIWLSSDNRLVDGGIASAPEIGVYNDKFGWGMGIEQIGVEPDYEVENNPRTFYDGKDEQLEKAIEVLHTWLENEPVLLPKRPGPYPNLSFNSSTEGCPAQY